MRNSEEREREEGSGSGASSLLTTLVSRSCYQVVYVLGWEPPVPDCRAVREQRQSVTTDNTNVSLEAVIRLFMC